MKILIIGDRHVGGYGLTAGQPSFVGHFIRQISQNGRSVEVEAYAHSTLSAIQSTLEKLPLERYDLIVVQTGQGCADLPAGLGAVVAANSGSIPDLTGDLLLPEPLPTISGPNRRKPWTQIRQWGKLQLMKALASIGRLPGLNSVGRELDKLLILLRPHRHKVVLLSPFPHQESGIQWLRQEEKSLLMRSEVRQLFSVFDSDSVVYPREEYFLENSPSYLNAIGHELIGLALFDFYVAAPTIVSIRPIRRN
ncbi:SGNH/GDSL hydrolase family protein [Spirosoma sp. SC4-14]|uniref:SGNH/GDSL hydrolase family protein n=1 Tax=Spirosoma sp. SC4-14 TaxID=3128900 RepID=UPI0030D3D467